MIGKYDLSVDINSHDFFHWLMPAKALGVSEVVLDISKGFRESIWPLDQTIERYRSIVKPGAALAGLPCREGTDGVRVSDFKIRHHIWFARNCKPMPRLCSPLPPNPVARYTVTLRQQPVVHLHRNSNMDAWMKFATAIDALVIPDYVVVPIDLHDRMAIYAGAEMNFGVDNGPMSILSMTDYPMMSFKYGRNASYLRKQGMEPNKKFPWMLKHQMMFWEDDDFPNIWRQFERWKHGAATT